ELVVEHEFFLGGGKWRVRPSHTSDQLGTGTVEGVDLRHAQPVVQGDVLALFVEVLASGTGLKVLVVDVQVELVDELQDVLARAVLPVAGTEEAQQDESVRQQHVEQRQDPRQFLKVAQDRAVPEVFVRTHVQVRQGDVLVKDPRG